MKFYKYQGAGNDFVMLDFMDQEVDLDIMTVAKICDRHFGIGADGLISISKSKDYDFKMRYYNSDGKEASFCGNGGRCVVAFAHDLGIIDRQTTFDAFDGIHSAQLLPNGTISLSMKDVNIADIADNDVIIDTGSPHFVRRVENPDDIDLRKVGAAIRYDKSISEDGVNVNFIHWDGKKLKIRTYERGVEDETLACGTGITASAIAICLWHNVNHVSVSAKGGELQVNMHRNGSHISDIQLIGPAKRSFSGEIIL